MPLGEPTMGHAERIIAEIATLDEAEQARLLVFVESLKAARAQPLTAQRLADRAALSASLAPFRVHFGDYRFDREEANAR
jgi:hypothetical protein